MARPQESRLRNEIQEILKNLDLLAEIVIMSNCLQEGRDAMPEANSIPIPSNLIQTQKYFLHSTRLFYSSPLSPCGGRGEGEGAIVKGLNAFVSVGRYPAHAPAARMLGEEPTYPRHTVRDGLLLCPSFPQHGDVPPGPLRRGVQRRHAPAGHLRHIIPGCAPRGMIFLGHNTRLGREK